MHFEINLVFLIKAVFSTWHNNQHKNLNILRTKRAFKVKKVTFIIFKGLLAAKYCSRIENAPLLVKDSPFLNKNTAHVPLLLFD